MIILYQTAREIRLLQIGFYVLLDTDQRTLTKFSFRFLTMTRFVRVTRVYAGLFFENLQKIVFAMMETIIDGPGSVSYKRISVSRGYRHLLNILFLIQYTLGNLFLYSFKRPYMHVYHLHISVRSKIIPFEIISIYFIKCNVSIK